jgi:hypothetical protein
MLCYAQATQTEAEPIESAIRARYPDATALVVAHVIDLRGVPSMFRGVAEKIMQSEFDKAARDLAPGQEAFDHVIVLPDWDGSFVTATGLSDVSERLGVAVFASSKLVGTTQEEPSIEHAFKLIEKAVV